MFKSKINSAKYTLLQRILINVNSDIPRGTECTIQCRAASLSRLPSALLHELRQLETKTIYLLASFGNLMEMQNVNTSSRQRNTSYLPKIYNPQPDYSNRLNGHANSIKVIPESIFFFFFSCNFKQIILEQLKLEKGLQTNI